MPGLKTNERPGTRAVLRHSRVSAYKAREVLDLIRGVDVVRAREILADCERDVAIAIGKLLDSAVANAEHNDQQAREDLFVSACFADEGATMKRWRPRARGRATQIRKRTCHITIIVSRLPEDAIRRRRAKANADIADRRARRVAAARRSRKDAPAEATVDASADEEPTTDEVETDELETVEVDEVETDAVESEESAETGADEAGDEVADEADAEEDK